MISLTVSNASKRNEIILPASASVADAFEKAGIDPSKGLVTIDGVRVKTLTQSLESVGAVDGSVLMSIIKNDNANN